MITNSIQFNVFVVPSLRNGYFDFQHHIMYMSFDILRNKLVVHDLKNVFATFLNNFACSKTKLMKKYMYIHMYMHMYGLILAL